MSTTDFLGAGVVETRNGMAQSYAVNDEADEAAPSTALADIEAELAAEVPERHVTLSVPARPGWSVRYLAEVSAAEMRAWRKAAGGEKDPAKMDGARFARAVLASKCRAILRHDVEVPNSAADGAPRTFQSPSMKSLYGCDRNIDVVAAFYGGASHDADIDAASVEVLRVAGWGEAAEMVADPLDRSSTG